MRKRLLEFAGDAQPHRRDRCHAAGQGEAACLLFGADMGTADRPEHRDFTFDDAHLADSATAVDAAHRDAPTAQPEHAAQQALAGGAGVVLAGLLDQDGHLRPVGRDRPLDAGKHQSSSQPRGHGNHPEIHRSLGPYPSTAASRPQLRMR